VVRQKTVAVDAAHQGLKADPFHPAGAFFAGKEEIDFGGFLDPESAGLIEEFVKTFYRCEDFGIGDEFLNARRDFQCENDGLRFSGKQSRWIETESGRDFIAIGRIADMVRALNVAARSAGIEQIQTFADKVFQNRPILIDASMLR